MSITMIGLDTAKSVFQVHAVDGTGQVAIRRKLHRDEVLTFFEKQGACTVAMEACGAALLEHALDLPAQLGIALGTGGHPGLFNAAG